MTHIEFYSAGLPLRQRIPLLNTLNRIERHNPQAIHHVRNVTLYASTIAEYAGYDSSFNEKLAIASGWHDIGKGHPTFVSVLKDNVTRDSKYFRAYKQHSRWGYQQLKSDQKTHRNMTNEELEIAQFVARYHHYATYKKGQEPLLQKNRMLFENARIKEFFPHIQDWQELYYIMQCMMISDEFDSRTNPRPDKIPPRTADFPLQNYQQAFDAMIGRFENVDHNNPKFDSSLYEPFQAFGEVMIENEAYLNRYD